MDILSWLDANGGVAHRSQLLALGFREADLRRTRSPMRMWHATDAAPAALIAAVQARGRLTCVSAAEHLGLPLLHRPRLRHLWAPAHASVTARADMHLHRAKPVSPMTRHALVMPALDVLAHVATCLPRLEALIVWEGALRRNLVTPALLGRTQWRSRAARERASAAGAKSDSLLETLVLHRLRELDVEVAQQVPLLGHDVDFLVGGRLVIQTDGYAFHSSARQRAEDLRHDAALRVAGYEVIRLSYADVVERWPETMLRIQQFLVLAGVR